MRLELFSTLDHIPVDCRAASVFIHRVAIGVDKHHTEVAGRHYRNVSAGTNTEALGWSKRMGPLPILQNLITYYPST